MPKVSVIIPVYRVEKYIERCCRSLFEQTLDDMEFLFIDDCTTDNSIIILKKVLEDYPNRYSQVRVLKMKENSGQAAVRNYGIGEVKGEYTIHCDSDDWVDTNMYKQMYDKAIHENADVVICDFAVSDGVNHIHKKGCYCTNKDVLINDLSSMRVGWSLWNKLLKTRLYDDIILPHNDMGEDMAIIMQIVIKANRFSYVPQMLYYYYSNPNSITRIKDKNHLYRRFLQVYNNSVIVIDVFKRNGLMERYKWPLLVLKLNVKRQAYDILNSKAIKLVWKNIYKDLDSYIWFCKYISVKEKIKYFFYIIK